MTEVPTGPDAAPLLATKLSPPRRRRSVVARPRLTERAAPGELPALTLVSAPAGFGKTTLLTEWLAATTSGDRRTAWLALDGGDDEPVRFWTYLLASVQTAVPEAGDDARARLGASQPMASVAASLVNDLARAGGEVVVVLDDYHVIEAAEVHETLAFVVDHAPANVHLVVASRVDPPLPLARLRSRGDLLEVRAADLRFTDDEATAYFNDAMGLDLSRDQVEALEARTEGWAAALQLAALSMQGRDDPGSFVADFAGDDRFVVDYLAEEVLERQREPVRRFLLETSILDRFTATLCDAVTGGGDGAAMLEELDRANLFLVALDDRRVWYRYHHLFADVLRARLLAEGTGRIDELHRRASAWHEGAGDASEAIRHALAGHDPERAARLVELAAPLMRRTRQEVTLHRWLTSLPEELFASRPVLTIELVGARMISGDVDGVAPLLDAVEAWLDPGVDPTTAVVFDQREYARLPAQVAVYRAALALVAGDTEATIAHARAALERAEPDDHLRRGSAAALVGLAEWTIGALDDATVHYTEAIRSLTAAGHVSDVMGCSIALADMRIAQGRLGEATRVLEAALRLARDHDVVRGTADMHVGLAELRLDVGDVDGAREHLDDAAALGEEAGLPQHPYRWRVARARLLQAEGDDAAALPLLTEAEAVYDTDMSPPVRPVTATTARARLRVGDVAGARRWAATGGLRPDDDPDHLREYEHVTLARLLLADGAADAAVRLLERLLAAAEAGGRDGSVVEILVLLALARQACGDPRSATATLEEALARAEPEGRLGVLTAELPALGPLLGTVTNATRGSELARAALGTGAPAASPAATASPLVDPLSDRELDVLRLLHTDLSGPDIARELFVSVNTFRTHTKSIYAKLGVNNRREAVRRAAELGL